MKAWKSERWIGCLGDFLHIIIYMQVYKRTERVFVLAKNVSIYIYMCMMGEGETGTSCYERLLCIYIGILLS